VNVRRPLVGLTAVLSFAVAGCYTLKPVTGAAPKPGMTVAFDVNDVGRVALGGTMGPEIGQIEGKLLEDGSGEYLLSVSLVRLLRGGEQTWNGEQVRLKPEYLGNTYERRFSLGRSLAIGALSAGGLAAIIVTRNLLGGGNTGDGGQPCDTCGTQRLGRP